MRTLDEKPSILILGKLPPPYYGPAIATEIILTSSLKREYNLIHIDTRLNKTTTSFGKFSFLKLWKSLTIYLHYFQTLQKKDIDLVLIPISQSTTGLLKDYPFFLIAKLFKPKIVLQLRGSNLLNWFNSVEWGLKKVFTYMFTNVNGAIVLGNKLRYIFQPFLDDDKIFVVPNGSDYNMPEKNKSDKIRLLFLGNLQMNKAPDILLKSLTELPTNILENVTVNIAGEWESQDFEKQCKEIVEQHSLPVKFFEPVSGEDKFSLLKNTEIFIFTPRAPEGHPWVIVEAMAAGLPIISTDQGAITESVLDNENGFIIPNESPKNLADRIQTLVENHSLRNRMSEKSYTIYKQRFTKDEMVKNLSQTFNRVLSI